MGTPGIMGFIGLKGARVRTIELYFFKVEISDCEYLSCYLFVISTSEQYVWIGELMK